jgi:predicted O-methyltransferase YrrM
MLFDIGIVNYNTDFFLHNLLRSLQRVLGSESPGDVHVWDNGSSDASAAILEQFQHEAGWLRVHRSPCNLHHGPAMDALLREHARSDWMLLLDSDTEIRRSFADDLERSTAAPVAFVGQIHPQMPRLYAYLAHLLIYVPWYREMPGFRHHGAPGIDFFGFVEAQGIPFGRFRWREYIHHYGQGTLRGIYDRGERQNPFYRFAARECRANPPSADAQGRTLRMREELARSLSMPRSNGQAAPAPIDTGSPDSEPVGAPPPTPAHHPAQPLGPSLHSAPPRLARAVRASVVRPPWGWPPGFSGACRRARRLGLAQHTGEIRRLFIIVKSLKPRRLLEVGTAHGGSLYLWTRAARSDAELISVDLPPWEIDDPEEARKLSLLRALARRRQQITCIRGDSHAGETARRVAEMLDGRGLDFLFLDGDASYAGMRADFRTFAPHVRRGGVIALHGVCGSNLMSPTGPRSPSGAACFWGEIKSTHRNTDLIADPSQRGSGIGVVWV